MINEIIEGSFSGVVEENIDENSYYNISISDGGLTNAQMASALSHPEFFNVNDVYQCLDNGTYRQNHFYKFTGSAWVDTTPQEEHHFELFTISEWIGLDNKDPYMYCATITASYNIGEYTLVELINNQAVLFANCGFAIGDVTGQDVTIYAIEEPSSNVSLTIDFRG